MIILEINLEFLKKLEVFNGELKKMKKKCLNLEIEEKFEKKEKMSKILWREGRDEKMRNRRARLAW